MVAVVGAELEADAGAAVADVDAVGFDEDAVVGAAGFGAAEAPEAEFEADAPPADGAEAGFALEGMLFWLMLGGLGKEGVVMGGRGRDTGIAIGFGASMTGVETVVAGLLSALLVAVAVAPDADVDVTAGLTGVGGVAAAGAEAVLTGFTACVDAAVVAGVEAEVDEAAVGAVT